MQYIVKPACCGAASAFPWHRDRDWLAAHDVEETPYISVRMLPAHVIVNSHFSEACGLRLWLAGALVTQHQAHAAGMDSS